MSYLEFKDLLPYQYSYFMEYIYNGVGSDKLWVKGPEFIFRNPAKQHDFEGYGGGTEQDRLDSDKLFLENCLLEIGKRKPYKKYIYTPIAYLYYALLKGFSRFAWDYYPERPKTWDEYLERVELAFNKEKKQIPALKQVARILIKRNVKNKEKLLSRRNR
jgi:hypothetical protein